MSNSPLVLRPLSRRCGGNHPHRHLANSRGSPTAHWPPQLCQAVVHGYRRQLVEDQGVHQCQMEWRPEAGSRRIESNGNPVYQLELKRCDEDDDSDLLSGTRHGWRLTMSKLVSSIRRPLKRLEVN